MPSPLEVSVPALLQECQVGPARGGSPGRPPSIADGPSGGPLSGDPGTGWPGGCGKAYGRSSIDGSVVNAPRLIFERCGACNMDVCSHVDGLYSDCAVTA